MAISTPKNTRKLIRQCPSFTQVQESECGPASLGMLLAYFGCYLILPELSNECDVTRDGTHVIKLLSVSKKYGLELAAKPYKFNRLKEESNIPCMAYWQYSHWIVVEGYSEEGVYINDPGNGRSFKSDEEFKRGYSNILLKPIDSSNVLRQGNHNSLDKILINSIKPIQKYVISGVVFSSLFSIPSIVIAFCTGIFVENVVQDSWTSWTNPVLATILIMGLFQIAIKFYQFYLQRRLKLKAQKISAETFARILFRQNSEFFERRNPGEVSSRIAQLDGLINLATNSFIAGSASTCSSVIYMLVIFLINPFMGLYVIGIIALYCLLIFYVGRSLLDKSKRLSVSSGYAYGATLLAIDNAHSVKSMSLQTGVLDTWLNSFFKQSATGQEITIESQGIDSIADFTDSILKLGLIGVGGLLVINNSMELSSLVAISMLFQAMSPEIKNVVQYLKDFANSYGDIARIADSLYEKDSNGRINLLPSFSTKQDILKDSAIHDSVQGKESDTLEFSSNLSFTYDKESKYGIKIDSGKLIKFASHYQLTNSPGSGRTTFFKLLCGELDWNDQQGNATNKYCMKSFTEIAYFNEQPSFFPGKLIDTITTYKSRLNNEDFATVCEELGIQKYIEAIPNRLEFKIDANQTNISFRTALMMDIARAISEKKKMLLFDYTLDPLDATFISNLESTCAKYRIGTITSTRKQSNLFSKALPLEFIIFNPIESKEGGQS